VWWDSVRKHGKSIAVAIGAFALVAVILWLDISTGVWSEVVILSGLAAGLVTFILTVMVLDRVVARSTARRWAPVTRLALSEFLHAAADDEHSEISRGHIVPRRLPVLSDADAAHPESLHAVRELVVDERTRLTDTLSRWTGFLASSGDNETVLIHIADIALNLDRIRDAAVEAEHSPAPAQFAALRTHTESVNASLGALTDELRSRLAQADLAR